MTGAKIDRTLPLNEKQRKLVADNTGLVAVHLRRNVPNLAMPRRDREWEDLFQEGCMGLIDAARTHREDSGIPFPAYAFPRIHNAVSRALRTKFTTVRVPLRAAPRGAEGEDAASHRTAPHDPRVVQLAYDVSSRIPDRRHGLDDGQELIGERLRDKYERALDIAEARVAGATSRRGDRQQLAHALVEHRLRIPRDEFRRPLRQVARETKSSFARVAQCEKQINASICETLDADPEFHELRRRQRLDPNGRDVVIDSAVGAALANVGNTEFRRRFEALPEPRRAKLLYRLVGLSGTDVCDFASRQVMRLSPIARETILREAL